MNRLNNIWKALVLFSLIITGFQSCSEDAVATGDQTLTEANLQTILSTDDIAGTADNALAELFANGASAKSAKGSNDCYSAEYTDTGFVATFNNCVLNGTDNVNGTLTVTYEVGNETAAFTAVYEDFYVGDIKINGTRNYALSANSEQNTISFTVESDMTIEMEDGSIISENGTKTFSFTFGDSLENSTFSLSGTWQVQAEGDTYSVTTINDLQGTLSCEYLTSGSMNVTKNGLTILVDFGEGECDDVATLTYPDGTKQEIGL
ncbi:MAG: hypothetical protein AB3N10_05400 [Allomuricauda sp.]